MAKKKQGIKSVAGLVFKSIWLVFAAIMFAGGSMFFFRAKSFSNWLIWGVFCLFPMLGSVIRDIIVSAREGARRGANSYTVSVSGNTATVSNHPFREAIISIVVSIFASILMGPVALGVYMLVAIIQIICFVIVLVKRKKAKNNATK